MSKIGEKKREENTKKKKKEGNDPSENYTGNL